MFLNAKWFYWVLLVICFVLLLTPILLREKYASGLIIDGESYRSIRLAQEIKKEGILNYDKLSYGGRFYVGEKSWFLLLSFNPELMAKYLPILFGILSFTFFYLLLGKLNPKIKGLASLILITSPTYLYIFSTATKYVAAIFFALLGFYLFFNNRKNISYISFILCGLFSVFSLFLVTVFFLFYGFKKKKFMPFLLLLISNVILFFISYYKILELGLPDSLFSIVNFSFANLFSFFVFDLGSNYGLGLFLFILSLIGIYTFYKEKYRFLLFYFLLAVLIFSSLYVNFIIVPLGFLLACFAAIGLIALLKHEWKSDTFKFLTILVVFCGLLFSLMVFYQRTPDFYPQDNYKGAVEFLANQEDEIGVLSDSRNGDIINYAGKHNFMDDNFQYAPNLNERLRDMNTILTSKELNVTEPLLEKYNITYILLDNKMKNDNFISEEEGLLFLLKYSPHRFYVVYNEKGIEIWSRRTIILV